ncbi:MAG TPA: DNRLRE domain-containing protein [Candidatus Cloacimonetes bacterium]|nr:DNRLRE domain-containing protein [Candidatus Cloacimonadota bacterium]
MNKFISIMILVLLVVIVSCTQKNNYMGYDQDVVIVSDTISNALTFERSFTDTIGIYSSNSVMLVGNFNGVKTRSLMRFGTLPDTTWLDSTSFESCEILFERKSHLETDINIHAYKLLIDWSVGSTTWDSIGTDDYEDFTTPVEFVTDADSFYIPFDSTIVKDWIINDTLNYGMLLDAPDAVDNFVEFYTFNSNDNGPKLKIVAIGAETGKKDTLLIGTTRDAFIGFDENMQKNYDPGKMIIANLPPSRLILKVHVDSIYTQLGISLDRLKQYSINLAELQIDSLMVENSYVDNDYISIIPYYVSDTQTDECTYISTTPTSYFRKNDSLSSITITPLLEGMIRGDLSNPYIALVSTQENKDYSFVELFENSTPALRIIYTKPVLE